MTTQDFKSMLEGAKKGAGLITAGGVTLQCIAATHGVSKSGGDPQIVGSYKIVGGQFNGRTMKGWHTLKSDTPASVMGFFEEMAAFGISESEIVAMGQPNDQAMAALATRMVNKIVGADVYHQDDQRNPGKKSAWLQNYRAHTGPMPQVMANGGAPAPAPGPAPTPYGQQPPMYGQQPQPQAQQYPPQQQAPGQYAPQPAYGQQQAPAAQPQGYPPQQPQMAVPGYPQPQAQQQASAPATHSGMPPQHSGQYQQAPVPGYPPAQQGPPIPAGTGQPVPGGNGNGTPNGFTPGYGTTAPPATGPVAGDVSQPQPPQPVPGEQQYNQEPPF